MTENWRARRRNNSISNSSSGDLLFVCFALFCSSSLIFSLSRLSLNFSYCFLPSVVLGAWISWSEVAIKGVLWKKVGLQLYYKTDTGTGVFCEFWEICKNGFSQNTSGQLLLHVADEKAAVDKILYDIVRKSWINFTWHLVARSHFEKGLLILKQNLIGY